MCKKSGLILLVDSKVVAACVPAGIGLQIAIMKKMCQGQENSMELS